EPVGPAAQHLPLANAGDGTRRERAHSAQRRDGGPTAEAIGHETNVALELGDRVGSLLAEDAVLAAGVEPERVQLTLELGDVVATQHGLSEVERPIAERETALDERGPRLAATEPGTDETALLLDCAASGGGGRAELAG